MADMKEILETIILSLVEDKSAVQIEEKNNEKIISFDIFQQPTD
mgnify:CR=1 FL=1